MLLDFFCSVGCGDFRHSSTFSTHLKIYLDCSSFTVCCFAFEKHACHVVVTSFAVAVSVDSRPRWNKDCLWLCLCWDDVEEARRRRFLMGGCSARCEDVFFFVPCQTKAGRSRLFEKALVMIFFFAVMSVSFCDHAQCLIQRRFLVVLLRRRLCWKFGHYCC